MKRYKIVKNESFDKYIDYTIRGRGRRFENRWDSLDLDDIAADVEVPTDSEIDAAVRELDLLDDAAIKTGAKDIDVSSNGKIRLLDLDNDTDSIDTLDYDNDRARELDFDDPVEVNYDDSVDGKVRELDFDEPAEVKAKKSNLGNVIGALDYDDDINTSGLVASIDDVYTALASSDPKIVKSMIKRYAADITDSDKISEVLLGHATQLNYESIRIMCGDMRIILTAKEKQIEYIDRSDIKNALERFKKIASKLDGSNNTYGLIPNAIVSCSENDQIKCTNIIDFLITWLNLPLIPMYFRGAIVKKCYSLADFLIDNMPDVKFSAEFLTGARGLLTRVKNYNDIPKNILNKIIKRTNINKLRSSVVADLMIMMANNKYNKAVKDIYAECGDNKKYMVIDYIEDNEMAAFQAISNILNLE